jgi:hypothetical protein
MSKKENFSKVIAELENKKESLSKRLVTLVDLLATEAITRTEYSTYHQETLNEIQAVTAELSEYGKEFSSPEEFDKRTSEIFNILLGASENLSYELIDASFISRYVDRINIKLEKPFVIGLEVKLLTGEKCSTFLEKIAESRMGHFSKKMVESYENSIKGTK